MKQSQVIVNNLSINYYSSNDFSGEGSLVMLHGWGSSADIFKGLWSEFSNFIAVDLPGFGQSQTPVTAWRLDDYVSFLRLFLNKLNITAPILLGHSFGGSVIIKYSVVHSDIEKIILVNSAGVRKKTAKKNLIKKLSPGFNFVLNFLPVSWQAKIKQSLYQKLGANDYMNAGSLKETFKNIINEDLSGLFDQIKTKTLIIWGDNDHDTLLEDAKELNHKIISSDLVILQNAGHYSFLDNQKDFIETVKTFLNK